MFCNLTGSCHSYFRSQQQLHVQFMSVAQNRKFRISKNEKEKAQFDYTHEEKKTYFCNVT